MRKADMVRRIAEELGCTNGQADAAVEALLATIKGTLQQGGIRDPAPLWHLARAGEARPRRP
jgi:hypothetical protein